jgi:NADPH-dependent ferric siderophore reductase
MNQPKELIIQSGTVLENRQIAAHTFHLKIQSDDFADMQCVGGFTVDIFLGNPYENANCENRKYSFWNYEPVYHIVDLAICTFSNGKGAKWIQKLQQGNRIFFKPPKGKLLADNSAENYLLIGDITSLSHLYEIHRNLAVSKNIFSFIYAEQEADFFPDIDNSFPLHHYIINPTPTHKVVNKIVSLLPAQLDNTIAYVFGHPEVCIALHHYLKHNKNMPTQYLRTKPFWKAEKNESASAIY